MPDTTPVTPGEGPVSQHEHQQHATPASRKRPGSHSSGSRYPRKRSLKACLVCRNRKTKCDNVRPSCGFCTSINISCSYDAVEKDHSAFDPASLEILRQLGRVISSQEELLHHVRSVAGSQPQPQPQATISHTLPPAPDDGSQIGGLPWEGGSGSQSGYGYMNFDWVGHQPDSASTTPTASAGAAAVRWFGLLANDASREALEAVDEDDVPPTLEGGFLDPFGGQDEDDMTPLQRATKIIDSSPPGMPNGEVVPEERLWEAPMHIALLDREQVLFKNFLHRICSWLDLFDPAHTISTRVPHLAIRNAGLLNAILALSAYHRSFDETVPPQEPRDRNNALQYYYQTLHYVQKAMRYPSYQNSLQLMVTTLIVSTYEMLRGSRKDWQQHLQGVFWILRSRQIEVETSSLESATWWAWLRQDIWVAFRQRRRTYSTWTPKKALSELNSHELASRAIWILAQVVNFCAVDATEKMETTITGRLAWSKALRKMLQDWEWNLTVEFSQLPATVHDDSQVFKPRLIHPPCFGLAVQIHHVSRILVVAHEPQLDGLESFISRQKSIQDSIEIVCGIGMTLTDDASSVLSSQCLFIAGMFMNNPAQRTQVLAMLDRCRAQCGWPTPSLGSELQLIWDKPEAWGVDG